MINWNNFEDDLVSYFKSRHAKSEEDGAKYITDTYDRYVKLGTTQYGNSILSSKTQALQTFIYAGLLDARNGNNLQRTSQRISQGIILYWLGIKMGTTFPPPSSTSVVSNVIIFPGIPINIAIRNTQNIKLLAKTLVLGFKSHMLTIMGINTSLVPTPSGAPIPIPFEWVGIK